MKPEIKIFKQLPEDGLKIRITVFVEEQGFVDEKDSTDDIATHLVAYIDGTPVANCRIFESDEKDVYILGRLCVLKEYRGRGIGKAMLCRRRAGCLFGRSFPYSALTAPCQGFLYRLRLQHYLTC